MATLNKPICATSFGNTGYGDCFIEPKKFIGSIQVPQSFEIGEEDVAALQEKFLAAIHALSSARAYPYPQFIDLSSDNTEDETINTNNYGNKTRGSDGSYDWSFRYADGGVVLHGELQKNEGRNKYFLFFDENNVLYGYKQNGKLKGIPVDQFIVPKWRIHNGTEEALYTLRFIIKPIYINRGNLGYIPVQDFNLIDLHGLQDVVFELTDQTDNVFKVKAATKISGVNLYGVYKSNLSAATAWIAKNVTQDDSFTVDSVTGDDATESFVLTLNATEWLTVNDQDVIGIKLAAASVLNANPINVEGFDSKDEDMLKVTVDIEES